MRVDSLKQIYIYQQVSQIIVIFCNSTNEKKFRDSSQERAAIQFQFLIFIR